MRFRNIFLSFFVIFAFGLALVHADDAKKAPRGPKITNKVRSTATSQSSCDVYWLGDFVGC